MAFFELLLESAVHTNVGKTIRFVRQNSGRTPFLTYDSAALLNWYRDETCAFNELPYTEIACFLEVPWSPANNLVVVKRANQFELASHAPDAFEAFTTEGRVDKFDSQVVRLERYIGTSRTFEVRPCRYSDGLRSNYAMDWRGEKPFSLRSLMAQDYGPHLPPLDERRLSNALGLAVIVWYRTEEGDLLPYLPKRAARSAVFRGGFHCTASGEAEWKAEATTFDEMFTAHVCKELYEEVGLLREDLHWIVPVALCREFLRGGKPQLFFVALARADEHELAPRRREAIRRQIEAGRQEILDDFLTVENPEQLYRDLARQGTIESFANMCYAQICAESAYRAGALDL